MSRFFLQSNTLKRSSPIDTAMAGANPHPKNEKSPCSESIFAGVSNVSDFPVYRMRSSGQPHPYQDKHAK
jgi:hypothetical protein